jgi:DNA replication licensing factor MCM5
VTQGFGGISMPRICDN